MNEQDAAGRTQNKKKKKKERDCLSIQICCYESMEQKILEATTLSS